MAEESRSTHKLYEKEMMGEVRIADEHVSVDLSLNIRYGYNIPAVSEQVQEKVSSAIENMTGLTVLDVNIKIAGVNMEES